MEKEEKLTEDLTQTAQYKKDRVKEVIVKGLILFAGLCIIAMIVFIFLAPSQEEEESFLYELFFVLAFVCLGVGILSIAAVFIIGRTIKTANQKGFKIETYQCDIDKTVRESCQTAYGEVHNFTGGVRDFYSFRIKPEGLTKSEIYCFACLEVDESFDENAYIAKIEQITELDRKDIYARTLIVCFVEKQPCKYVDEIMHSSEYYGLNEILIFCTYDAAGKTLSVNKSKSPYGNKGYNDAVKELSKIFSFVTPQQIEKQSEDNQETNNNDI